jgi:atypical dual specificity phosphatase
LICLEEKIAYDASLFARQGICVTHEPIPDMRAPRIERARRWCQLTSEAWAKGEGVVFHCFAGLGRTGTAIASCLIFWGASAESALRRVRTVEPRAVHTAEQESFLVLFEGWLRDQEEPMPRQAR